MQKFTLGGKEGNYVCYYGAVATYKYSLDDFRRWYPAVRDMICAHTVGKVMPGEGGDAYNVATEAIVLAMPYGFVPAYQR
jgi:hypothetical protein